MFNNIQEVEKKANYNSKLEVSASIPGKRTTSIFTWRNQ